MFDVLQEYVCQLFVQGSVFYINGVGLVMLCGVELIVCLQVFDFGWVELLCYYYEVQVNQVIMCFCSGQVVVMQVGIDVMFM